MTTKSMTTLFGIILEDGKEGLLASDNQASNKATSSKYSVNKLSINDSTNFVVGSAGVIDSAYEKLFSKLIQDKIDVEKIVRTGNFPELRKLNLERWNYQLPIAGEYTSLLFLTNFENERKLYTAWPLGKVEERTLTSIGSGSRNALEYINAKDNNLRVEHGVRILGNKEILSEQGRELAYNAVNSAIAGDLYSSGINMVIMNDDGIRDVGAELLEHKNGFDKGILDIILKDNQENSDKNLYFPF